MVKAHFKGRTINHPGGGGGQNFAGRIFFFLTGTWTDFFFFSDVLGQNFYVDIFYLFNTDLQICINSCFTMLSTG